MVCLSIKIIKKRVNLQARYMYKESSVDALPIIFTVDNTFLFFC